MKIASMARWWSSPAAAPRTQARAIANAAASRLDAQRCRGMTWLRHTVLGGTMTTRIGIAGITGRMGLLLAEEIRAAGAVVRL